MLHDVTAQRYLLCPQNFAQQLFATAPILALELVVNIEAAPLSVEGAKCIGSRFHESVHLPLLRSRAGWLHTKVSLHKRLSFVGSKRVNELLPYLAFIAHRYAPFVWRG
jgi:hypothetical protein